ncbi:MAG TPA: MFS transporter [Gemmataceae bacterium]|nr:MFS transporter [Gemmataceae bacterium]
MGDLAPSRGRWFRWYVCVLLLLATAVNYMDRQTLANAAVRVTDEFQLKQEQYGDLEFFFGVAFGCGAFLFGIVADRVGVRWLYPAVLLAWSAMGVATGWVQTFAGLLLCRTLLGLFESGHWPCALKTTQRLLSPRQRTFGNSILQAGASIGAIITPKIMKAMLTEEAGSWRLAFQVIGAAGFVWVILWLPVARGSDLSPPAEEGPRTDTSPAASPGSLARKLLVLIVVVVAINTCWQIFRAWLPMFLQKGRGYSEEFALDFTFWYYIATDVGCIAAGAASVGLHRLGLTVGTARWFVFTFCAAGTALSIGVAYTPAGNLLLFELLLIAAASLGLFPCYYSLAQEVSVRHQGKVSGSLGMIGWLASAPMQKFFGRLVDETHSYDLGFAVVGCLPLVAAAVWWFAWNRWDR